MVITDVSIVLSMFAFWIGNESNLLFLNCFPELPDLQLDASVRDRIVVHAGGVIRIIAYVSGKPPPTVTWNMNERALPQEATIETTAISSSMVIKNCQRSHQGVYSLLAKNAAGERKKTIIVDVLGKNSVCPHIF